MKIKARVTGDPRLCEFVMDRVVAEGSVLCRSVEEARGSVLLEKLMALPGVAQVWAEGDRVTVSCREPQSWETAGRAVAHAIRTALAENPSPLVASAPSLPVESLFNRVRDVLQADVNPGLALHGGQAELVSVHDGVAEIKLTGGCQGCGAAKMTISFGIEKSLRSKIPELRGVRDLTDHASGDRPYFRGAGASPFEPPHGGL